MRAKSRSNIFNLIRTTLTIGIFLLITVPLAKAQSPSTTSLSTRQDNLIARIKQNADTEITNRIDLLNKIITRTNGNQRIDPTCKTQVTTDAQTNISGLNALKTKIDADTDLTTLRADRKSIYINFRIYAVVAPRDRGEIVACSMEATTNRISTILDKIQARINKASQAGKDVSQLNTLMADARSKLADAKTQYQNAISQFQQATPQNYPDGSRGFLIAARNDIKAGQDDLKAIQTDAHQMISILKGFNSSSSPIPSPSATP